MRLIRGLLVALALGSGVSNSQVNPGPSFVPREGYVPDAATAVAIAEAVLTPVYGKEIVLSERPFKATLRANIWTVAGSDPPCAGAPAGVPCPGGTAEVRISKKSGQIVFMAHYQ
jgi:hypothetical protein